MGDHAGLFVVKGVSYKIKFRDAGIPPFPESWESHDTVIRNAVIYPDSKRDVLVLEDSIETKDQDIKDLFGKYLKTERVIFRDGLEDWEEGGEDEQTFPYGVTEKNKAKFLGKDCKLILCMDLDCAGKDVPKSVLDSFL